MGERQDETLSTQLGLVEDVHLQLKMRCYRAAAG